ncbi:hypothetical protein ACFQ9J_05405 [Streptomyces sp. NPDC056529]|uniref:hypothetical protein n=1 Tax=Streptomyces sp. NPDC056529 TaxID=3345855 RepID=UPI0036CA0B58
MSLSTPICWGHTVPNPTAGAVSAYVFTTTRPRRPRSGGATSLQGRKLSGV